MPGRAAPSSKTTAAPGLSSRAVLPLGTYTVKSEAKIAEGMALLDTPTTTFTVAEPRAAAPPTQAVSRAPIAPMTVVATEESPVAPGTVATRAPLGVMTIMLALAAGSGILVLRRRN